MAYDNVKRKERVPVEGPLRRLPGQSVREERDRLINDKLSDYLLLAVGFWFLAGWEWFRRWNPFPYGAEVVTIFAFLMTGYCAFRVMRLRKDIRNLNLAEKGERRVSELLTQLRRKRYVAVDDIVGPTWNIDHVLVGPGGVFAIETKAYSLFGNGRVGVDSEGVLRLSNKPAFKDLLGQTKAAAKSVKNILRDRLRRDIPVTPVLVFPGWALEGAKTDTGVVVLNDGTITNFFKSQSALLSDEEITAIVSHLDQVARS